jgi:T-complex protein 1 subunit beta
MVMAKAIDDEAATTPGKLALAMRSFATALRKLPTYIAENAGYDASELVAQLVAAHNRGEHEAGCSTIWCASRSWRASTSPPPPGARRRNPVP